MKCKILLLVVFFLFYFVAESTAEKEERVGIGIRYSFFNYTVDKMPLRFRTVPIHPDDDYADKEDNYPIKQTKYNRSKLFSVEFEPAHERHMTDNLRIGLGFIWMMHGVGGCVGLNNYTNYPGTEKRGIGAALTFTGTKIHGPLPVVPIHSVLSEIFNWTPKIYIDYYLNISKNDLLNKLRLCISYHRYIAVNGWDRYNHYTIDESKTLAHIFPISIEVNIWKGIIIGITHNINSITDFGKQAKTNINSTTFSIAVIGDVN